MVATGIVVGAVENSPQTEDSSVDAELAAHGDYSWLLCFRMYSVSSSITWHHFNQGQIQRTNTKQCLITEPVISSTTC